MANASVSSKRNRSKDSAKETEAVTLKRYELLETTIKLAHEYSKNESADQVVERAQKYYDFIILGARAVRLDTAKME